jgi:hypothetical protein
LFTTSERERETVESGVCVVREREREEGVTRVYARLAARRNATYKGPEDQRRSKGIRIKRTSYVVSEFIRSTSYVLCVCVCVDDLRRLLKRSRLNTKLDSRSHCVDRGRGIPKEREEDKRREV